jgi:hypothetical protein
MAYDLTYEVEDIGEWFGAEFGCVVQFDAAESGYQWQIDIKHIDLFELSVIQTLGNDMRVRARIVKERRDVPAWLWQIIGRNYRDAMVAVAESAADDARYDDTAASRADDYRDELINREMRG